jgi:hypothetical protein
VWRRLTASALCFFLVTKGVEPLAELGHPNVLLPAGYDQRLAVEKPSVGGILPNLQPYYVTLSDTR